MSRANGRCRLTIRFPLIAPNIFLASVTETHGSKPILTRQSLPEILLSSWGSFFAQRVSASPTRPVGADWLAATTADIRISAPRTKPIRAFMSSPSNRLALYGQHQSVRSSGPQECRSQPPHPHQLDDDYPSNSPRGGGILCIGFQNDRPDWRTDRGSRHKSGRQNSLGRRWHRAPSENNPSRSCRP